MFWPIDTFLELDRDVFELYATRELESEKYKRLRRSKQNLRFVVEILSQKRVVSFKIVDFSASGVGSVNFAVTGGRGHTLTSAVT